jgi:hypothetical protein
MQNKEKESYKSNAYRQRLATNKMHSIASMWYSLKDSKLIDKDIFTFNYPIATRVVYHYVRDLEILKDRYGMISKEALSSYALPSKIAGLMANSILKYRPIVPIDGGNHKSDITENKANEILAIYHGICVCTNYYEAEDSKIVDNNNEAAINLFKSKHFNDWSKDIKYLLWEREYTSESLIAIFETLRMAIFPNGDASSRGL